MDFSYYRKKVVANKSSFVGYSNRIIYDEENNIIFGEGSRVIITPIPIKREGSFFWQAHRIVYGVNLIMVTTTFDIAKKFETDYSLTELRSIWIREYEDSHNGKMVSIWKNGGKL